MNNQAFNVKGTYRDYDILYQEAYKEWEAMKDGESIYMNADADKVKKYIDKLYSTSFKRIKGLYANYRNHDYCEVTITSIDDEGNVWITLFDKSRRKVGAGEVLAYTEENLKIVRKIKESEKLEEKQQNITEALRESLKLAIKET